jgi:hypothetical protein
MKRIVLVYGLLAGAVMSAFMTLGVYLCSTGIIDFGKGEVLGYSSMFLAFLLIFFGIRSYRDHASGGTVSFGRALGVGLLIVAVSSLVYVATWLVIYYNFTPDFPNKMAAAYTAEMRDKGKSEAEIAAKKKEWDQMIELYKNPFVNAAVTFLEPLPVGLIATLLSAAILRRKPGGAAPLAAVTA